MDFEDFSYGFRPNKNAQQAVLKAVHCFFLSKLTLTVQPSKKTIYCDRSAIYQKAIKATVRRLKKLLQWLSCFLRRLIFMLTI